MQYPPPHHQEANFENCIYLAQSFPLATVISATGGVIRTSHLPLIYQKNNPLGNFVGHIDIYNPQRTALEEQKELELIFHGPETYISPTVYHSKQLPTWNYFKAHFKGIPRVITDKAKVQKSLIEMTRFLEGSAQAYRLQPDNPRMEAALPYIIGFEVVITHWEGKHKISQDKHLRDQAEAKNELVQKYPQHHAVIDRLYDQHQTKKK